MKRIMLIAALLLLTAVALAEPEDIAASFAAEQLPGYILTDGIVFDDTAMLLVEDKAGLVYFAGCVRDGEAWKITLSTAFPDWMRVALDTYHAGEGSMRLWTDRIPAMREYEDEFLDIYIDLIDDSTWRIWGVNNGGEVISFNRYSISLDVGYAFYGDFTLPLDITQVDWAALPRSFEEAMPLMDTARWQLIQAEYAPVYAQPDISSEIIALGTVGAPVETLSARDGMAEVRFMGRADSGWMLAEDLLPGSEQISQYEAWDENPDDYRYRDIIIDPCDQALCWYETAHDENTMYPFTVEHVEYTYQQGWCRDLCCGLLYSETLETCGYVPAAQLPYTIE